MTRPPLLPFALITWRDAHSDHNQWAVEAVPHIPLMITSAGWIIREDEAGITLASEQVMDNGSITYRGRTFILAETVVTVQRLSLGTRRKRAPMSRMTSNSLMEARDPA